MRAAAAGWASCCCRCASNTHLFDCLAASCRPGSAFTPAAVGGTDAGRTTNQPLDGERAKRFHHHASCRIYFAHPGTALSILLAAMQVQEVPSPCPPRRAFSAGTAKFCKAANARPASPEHMLNVSYQQAAEGVLEAEAGQRGGPAGRRSQREASRHQPLSPWCARTHPWPAPRALRGCTCAATP